jgi:hypothetical protein
VNQFPQVPQYPIRIVRIFLKFHEDIRSKFTAGVVDIGVNFPPVSTTPAVPVVNLPPVSLIPMMHLACANISAIFRKFKNDPYVIFKGFWEDDANLKQKIS